MEELFAIDNFYKLFNDFVNMDQLYTMLGMMLIAFYPMFLIVKKLVNPILDKLISIRGNVYADIIRQHKIHQHIGHIFIGIYLVFWSEIFTKAKLLTPFALHLKSLFLTVYTTIFISALLSSIINIFVDIYQAKESASRIPIGLHAHILKVLISICAILIILSAALNLDLSALLTSLGAAAALLTFVFKDTVLGLLASLQLTFQNIIKVGDWITVPSHHADGTVESITITVVKVRNFDKTVTTVPTYALISGGVKNWQAMKDLGGRRIKRSVSLNIDTVKFCDQKTLDQFLNIPLCTSLAKSKPELFKAENQVTNLTILRHYIREYIENHQKIHKKGFMCIVRQLQSNSVGVPIEVYVFTTEVDWAIHESIQADIFDHIYGVVPQFDLKVFQYVESTPDSDE